jgi:hypothetical protein
LELYAHAYKSNIPPHYDDIHLNKDGARILSERLAVEIDPVNSEPGGAPLSDARAASSD